MKKSIMFILFCSLILGSLNAQMEFKNIQILEFCDNGTLVIKYSLNAEPIRAQLSGIDIVDTSKAIRLMKSVMLRNDVITCLIVPGRIESDVIIPVILFSFLKRSAANDCVLPIGDFLIQNEVAQLTKY